MKTFAITAADTQSDIVAILLEAGLTANKLNALVDEIAEQNALADINCFAPIEEQNAVMMEADFIAAEFNSMGFEAQVMFVTESLGFDAGKEKIAAVMKALLHGHTIH